MNDRALQPLRERVTKDIFKKLYKQGTKRWLEEQEVNPRFVFPDDGQEAQEAFYESIDDICQSFDSVEKDNWKAYVSCFLE
jgi:hypothetical protein